MPAGSEEKLGPYWPLEDETSYARHAAEQMVLARQFEEYRGTAQQKQNYAAADMKGLAPEELARQLGVHVADLTSAQTTHEMTAGWLMQGQGDVIAYKNALSNAYAAYKTAITAALTPSSILGVMQVNDKIESEFRSTCDAARAGYEKSRDVIAAGVEQGKTPPMKGPTAGKPTDNSADARGGTTPVDGAPGSGVNPGLYDPSTGAYSSPAQGAGNTTPGGGTSAGGAAGGGTSAGGPAGGGLSSGGGPAPDLGGGSSGAGLGSGAGAGGPSAGGGSPVGGGMPMGGMPQMQPPQMPQMPGGGQTPGSDLAKTGAEMVTKLAGDKGAGAGGVPVTPEQLDKLLSKQGDGGGGLGGEKGDGPTADGPSEKGDKKLNGNTTSTVNGPGGNNAGGPGGTHPGTGAPAGPPSPAAPVTTHAPAAPSAAPMTELSADETPAGQQPQRAQDQQHHTAAPGTAQSTSMAPFPGPPPAAVGQTAATGGGAMMMPPVGPMTPPPAPSLGTYSPGALGAGSAPPAAPVPPPAAPAMPAGAVVAGAATAAAPVILPTQAGNGWSRTIEVTNYGVENTDPAYVSRLAALPAERALAHTVLAQTSAQMPALQWFATTAVGLFELVAGPPLYVIATCDALSLLPAGSGVPAPARLLSEFALNPVFIEHWSGYEHPAAILDAFATSPFCPPSYKLSYLVSSDQVGKTGRYTTRVPEITQTRDEQIWILEQGRVGMRARHEIGGMITPERAADALDAFGEVWHVTDAIEPAQEAASLWAGRWHADDDHALDDYPRALVRYLHAEAHQALAVGDLAEAAHAVSVLSMVEPKQHSPG